MSKASIDTLHLHAIDRDVTRIALGTWSMGGWMWGENPDQAVAEETVDAALDLGIDVIDTAPAYGFGLSEEVVGRVLERRGDREKVVVATKLGLSWDERHRTYRDSSPKTIAREIEDSLRRLKTDYVDLYQVHWPDPEVPIERTAEALGELLASGKVKALGVCNYSVEDMERFRKVAPLASCQSRFNLLERSAEQTVVPYSEETGLLFMAYSPLARGLLSGKMEPAHEPTDQARRGAMFHGVEYRENLEKVRSLDALARERYGTGVIQLAARWVLDTVEGSMVLWGARRPDQLDAVAGTTGWTLTARDADEVEAIVSAEGR